MDFIHIAQAAAEAVQHAAGTSQEAADPGVLGKLGINWKLFVAQLINFAIILLVLWKWVFNPVAKKLTERTEKIEKAIADADQTQKEKDEFFKWKETEMTRVRSQSAAIVAASQNEAAKAKQQILDETKKEQEKMIGQAKAKIEGEKNQVVREVKTEMADLITLATEKILREKLDNKKDKELINETLKSI